MSLQDRDYYWQWRGERDAGPSLRPARRLRALAGSPITAHPVVILVLTFTICTATYGAIKLITWLVGH